MTIRLEKIIGPAYVPETMAPELGEHIIQINENRHIKVLSYEEGRGGLIIFPGTRKEPSPIEHRINAGERTVVRRVENGQVILLRVIGS